MLIKKCFRIAEEQGLGTLYDKAVCRLKYKRRTPELIEEDSAGEQALLRQGDTVYPHKVLISIAVPLYNTKEEYLRQMIESLISQSYKYWELCLADGGEESCEETVRSYKDRRIKYKRLDKNYGIALNTNKAVEMAEGEYIGLLDHDDVLAPNALFEYRKRIDKGADFIYCDEASFKGDTAKAEIIHYKPDFSPYNLRANNYICHFSVFKKSLFDEVGGVHEGFEGSQDHDLILRLTERAKDIAHIRRILYFWRIHSSSVSADISAKPYCINSGVLAVSASLLRQDIEAKVESIGNGAACYRCNYKLRGGARCRRIKSCVNKAADNCKAEYIAIVPSCIEVDKGDMYKLISLASQAGVGAVGGIGTYRGRVSAGAVSFDGEGNMETAMAEQRLRSGGYMHRLEYVQNVNALELYAVVPLTAFKEIGGFDESLREEERLIDLCLRLKAKGMDILLNPEIRVKVKPFCRDMGTVFAEKHKERLNTEDEYFNNALTDYVM